MIELTHRISSELVTKDMARDWALLRSLHAQVRDEASLHGCPIDDAFPLMTTRPHPSQALTSIITVAIEWKVNR